MIKLMIIGRRCADKTRAEALHHLRTVHGPLVYACPPDAGPMPAVYVQNHVVDSAVPPALTRYGADRDLVTEIWFDDFAHLAASTQTRYYKTVLQPDEPRFVDDGSVMKAVVREGERWGRQPPDAVKLFVVLKRRAGVDAGVFEGLRASAEAAALGSGHVAGSVTNTPLPPPDGSAPFADSVGAFWFATPEDAGHFIEIALPAFFAAIGPERLADGSFYLLADEYPVERLRASRDVAA